MGGPSIPPYCSAPGGGDHSPAAPPTGLCAPSSPQAPLTFSAPWACVAAQRDQPTPPSPSPLPTPLFLSAVSPRRECKGAFVYPPRPVRAEATREGLGLDSDVSPAPTPGLPRQTSGGMTDADHSVSLKPMARTAPLNECPEAGTTPRFHHQKKRSRDAPMSGTDSDSTDSGGIFSGREGTRLYCTRSAQNSCWRHLLSGKRGHHASRLQSPGSPLPPPLCCHSREWAGLHFAVGKNEFAWFLSQVPGRSPLKPLCFPQECLLLFTSPP